SQQPGARSVLPRAGLAPTRKDLSMKTRDNPMEPAKVASEEASLPSRLRVELDELADDARSLDRSIAEHIAGAIVLDRRNSVHLGLLKVSLRFCSVSYRAREAIIGGVDSMVEGADWGSVSSSTTLRHLLNQYGDRLLGFDTKRDEITIELLSFDVVDSIAK